MGREQTYEVAKQEEKKPEKKETWKTFIWNSEKGEFFGRNGASWGKILLFYLIFYSCLGGFIVACFQGLLVCLPHDKPQYNVGEDTNPIIVVPGMGTIPKVAYPVDNSIFLPQFHFNPSDGNSYTRFVDELDTFLSAYTDNDEQQVVDCSGIENNGTCQLGTNQLGNCGNGSYGYDMGNPCVLLKVNKVHGWRPDLATENPNTEQIGDRWNPSAIPISCTAETITDGEIDVDMTFYPPAGFDVNCFPFCGNIEIAANTYLQPVLVVQFSNLPRDIEVFVWCVMWDARITSHHKRDREGGVRFSLLVNS